MFERFKDCLCHPRNLGKYNRDHIGMLFLMVFIFFVLYAAMLGVRTYTEKPFDESSLTVITSKIIQTGTSDIQFDSELKKITGTKKEYKGDGYNLFVLPEDSKVTSKMDDINIILEEEEASVYFGSLKASSIAYKDIRVSGFNFAEIAANNPTHMYYFKIFMGDILDSSNLFFQSFSFIQGCMTSFLFFLLCLFFSYILSYVVNPTIDKGVRFKLCTYDSCAFFTGSFFACLFNVGWLVYVSMALPMIFTIITFRHIVKVVVRR